jgi:hypothetical protein
LKSAQAFVHIEALESILTDDIPFVATALKIAIPVVAVVFTPAVFDCTFVNIFSALETFPTRKARAFK